MVRTQSPEQWSQNKINKDLCQKVAESVYDGPPINLTSGNLTLQLMEQTPTLTLWRSANAPIFVVGVRGTYDARDIKADALIPFNKLETSSRWKADYPILYKWKTGKYGQGSYGKYRWMGCGHSLGAALLDIMLANNLISYAVSYNGAVEPKYRASPLHFKIYSEADPMYKYGQILQQDPAEDIRKRKTGKFMRLATHLPSFLGTVATSVDAINEHSISRFKGGRMRRTGDGFKTREDILEKYFGKKKTDTGGKQVLYKPDEHKEAEANIAPAEDKKKRRRNKDPLARLKRELKNK